MQLSSQQNAAISQTLIQYYNNLLKDLIKQIFVKKCIDLSGNEQLDTFMFNVQYNLKKGSEEYFNKTKSSLFEFMQHQQNNKLTETVFRKLFEKYFLPASFPQPTGSDDNVLQMGIVLITNNICRLFQQKVKCKKYISLIQQNKIPSDLFVADISPIILQIQQAMHRQLLGQPMPRETEKSAKCKQCLKYVQDNETLNKIITLQEKKNKILISQLQELQNKKSYKDSSKPTSSIEVNSQLMRHVNDIAFKGKIEQTQISSVDRKKKDEVVPYSRVVQQNTVSTNNKKQKEMQIRVTQISNKQSSKKKQESSSDEDSEENSDENFDDESRSSGSSSETDKKESGDEYEDLNKSYQETNKCDMLDLSGRDSFVYEQE